jgi:GT2 family glycosyltransferase
VTATPIGSEVAQQTLSVVIPSWNGRELLRPCLDALAAQLRPPDEVIVVDNGSADHTLEFLTDEYPAIRTVALDRNGGFASAVNRGIELARGDYVVLLNNDAIADEGWLGALEGAMQGASEDVLFVTSKMLELDGLHIDSAGDTVDRWGNPKRRGTGQLDTGQFDDDLDVLAGCGGATMYRRAEIMRLGLFDEKFFAYFEDVDIALRGALQGFRGRYEPTARVRHAGSSTSARVPGLRERLCSRNGWFVIVKNVPAPRVFPMLAMHIALETIRLLNGLRDGSFGPRLHGHLEAARMVPMMWRERRSTQRGRTASRSDFDRGLSRYRPGVATTAPTRCEVVAP